MSLYIAVVEREAALQGDDPTTDLDQGANPEGGRGPGLGEADGHTDREADQGGEVDHARDTGCTLVVSTDYWVVPLSSSQISSSDK